MSTGKEPSASGGLIRSAPTDIPPPPTANVDPSLVLPRNLSHEGSFHSQHFWPQQAFQQARRRRLLQQQLATKKALIKCKRYVCAAAACPPPPPPPPPPVSAQQGSGGTPARSQGSPQRPSCLHASDARTYPAMAEGSHDSAEGKHLVKDNQASEAGYLSDTDTNFSEDYTQMTEVGEGSELGGRTPPGSFTSDLDSPSGASDGGWSSSTLSEGGGSPPGQEHCPYVSKAKANIRLLLGQASITDDDDNDEAVECATSPVDEELSNGAALTGGMTPSDSNATLFEDREFDFLKAEPVRRSTSLKTYKTPPGTPHKKKAVRFADALGLDLESVRHILNLEDPPTVPKSAMKDLKVGLEDEHRTEGTKYLAAYFSQPGSEPNFFTRVHEQKVMLESCLVDDKDMTVSGTCRVANIAYHKKVIVRYSINNWLTFEDVCASYVQNSNDGATDRFSFTINVPQYFSVGSRLGFALMYSTNGTTYWDNNHGQNYIIGCYAKAVPTHPSDSTWMHFL